jgi:hypothetical protein
MDPMEVLNTVFIFSLVLGAGALSFAFSRRNRKNDKPKPQSVGTSTQNHPKGHGIPRRNANYASALTTTYDPKVLTLADLLERSHEKFKNQNCLGERKVVKIHKEEKASTKQLQVA